jgi:hypothetical protein
MAGEDITGHTCLEINAGYGAMPASASIVKVYNNTFYGCGQSGLPQSGVLSMSVGGFTLDMKNNIFVSTEPYSIGDAAPAMSASNNLWFGAGAPPSWDSGALNVDPKVTDASANFRLAAGSPALQAGSSAVSAVCPNDLDGKPRDMAAAYDLGAYQSTP